MAHDGFAIGVPAEHLPRSVSPARGDGPDPRIGGAGSLRRRMYECGTIR
jgi:hypothetical protein